METRRIHSTPPGPAALRRPRRRGQRPFVLPRPTRDDEGADEPEEQAEDTRAAHDTTVSRELAEDEAGHHIDVRG